MRWPIPDEEPVVNTIILTAETVANTEVKRCARERQAKVAAGVWMWWTDRSRSSDGKVGGAAVCKHRDGLRAFSRRLGTGPMEVDDEELWAIGLALRE
jgi:hypothetical protein